MAAKGDIVKLYTGKSDDKGDAAWVPAIVTGDANEDGKSWVAAFPGDQKDDANLQGDVNALQSGPGTGTYEHVPL